MSSAHLEIIDACLQGDQIAMASLIERFQAQVFGLCFRMLGQRQDAEDMAQETFVRAIRSLAKWDKSRPFEPWLLAIAGNRCRTLLARRSKQPPSHAEVSDLPDHRPDLTEADNLAEEINLSLNDLRVEYRQAFLLFHESHFSYDKIAEVLDSPVGTVKTWVHRARKEIVSRLSARGVVHEKEHALRKA